MSAFKGKVLHLLKFPPHIIVKKALNAAVDQLQRSNHKKQIVNTDLRLMPTHGMRHSVFNLAYFETHKLDKAVMNFLCNMYKQHRFDLLGSGWIEHGYNSTSPGLEGHLYYQNLTIPEYDENGDWLKLVVLKPHLTQSQALWKEIIYLNPNYKPIDWQKDIKSGFRWESKLWFRAQRALSNNKLGVDIKMPWELGRLQHLPQMALWSHEDLTNQNDLIKEIVCQMLDFMMTNPVGMGANFNCPMDIGIRNANLLLTADLIQQMDIEAKIKSPLKRSLAAYIHQSTLHILADIEYREGKTSNHYLGNVLGVLFAGLYLTPGKQVNQFLAFGLQELQDSMRKQFFADGSNFEGSTAYHRLSAEMMTFGAMAALLTTDEQRIAADHCDKKSWKCKSKLRNETSTWIENGQHPFWKQLQRSVQFSVDISKNNGDIVLFGDNDSGRFMRLTPIGSWLKTDDFVAKYENLTDKNLLPNAAEIWDENQINHGGFISAGCGLFGIENQVSTQLFCPLEYNLGASIVSQTTLKNAFVGNVNQKQISSIGVFSAYKTWPCHKEKIFEFDVNKPPLNESLDWILYPDFQLAILKNNHVFMALSGISNNQQHISLSHVHNDKGAVELRVYDQDILLDPGTYLYTPLPKQRTTFRSVLAHNTIVVEEQEQNKSLPGHMGLFNLMPNTKCVAISVSENRAQVELHYQDIKHVRVVRIKAHEILIQDWCNKPFTQLFNPLKYFSNGYGKLVKQ